MADLISGSAVDLACPIDDTEYETKEFSSIKEAREWYDDYSLGSDSKMKWWYGTGMHPLWLCPKKDDDKRV
ncbi:hypothetical protein LCGC14_2898310 [marine sediment metagenome]|uniref:Uncharacterized protein n=1 Tax=marine sediment metagenome TaxID=412755 RepID=A0A0F9ALD0_9ZZZZ